MRPPNILARLYALTLCAALTLTVLTPASSVPAIARRGDSGDQVRALQQQLIGRGYLAGGADGVFGAGTEDAVRRFQKDSGLTPDGVAGVVTLTALGISFREGSRGADVVSIQERLSALGYHTSGADGVFGSGTAASVREFQRQNGLTADGVVGLGTAKRLFSAEAKRKSAAASASGGSVNGNEFELLARIISAEARGEAYSGQVAVGAVVLNRVNHPSFPDTVAGVVYQPGAFTAVVDGQIREPVADSSRRAAREALNGSDPSGGAIYYYNPAKTSNKWMRSREVIKVIGNHVFCK